MNTISIKKDDLVVVLSGKDKGKQGKVLSVIPSESKVVVEGVNVATKHKKATSQTEQGGIVKKEAPIYACKVQLMCPHCNKPRRFRTKVLADGTKERVCVKCGNSL